MNNQYTLTVEYLNSVKKMNAVVGNILQMPTVTTDEEAQALFKSFKTQLSESDKEQLAQKHLRGNIEYFTKANWEGKERNASDFYLPLMSKALNAPLDAILNRQNTNHLIAKNFVVDATGMLNTGAAVIMVNQSMGNLVDMSWLPMFNASNDLINSTTGYIINFLAGLEARVVKHGELAVATGLFGVSDAEQTEMIRMNISKSYDPKDKSYGVMLQQASGVNQLIAAVRSAFSILRARIAYQKLTQKPTDARYTYVAKELPSKPDSFLLHSDKSAYLEDRAMQAIMLGYEKFVRLLNGIPDDLNNHNQRSIDTYVGGVATNPTVYLVYNPIGDTAGIMGRIATRLQNGSGLASLSNIIFVPSMLAPKCGAWVEDKDTEGTVKVNPSTNLPLMREAASEGEFGFMLVLGGVNNVYGTNFDSTMQTVEDPQRQGIISMYAYQYETIHVSKKQKMWVKGALSVAETSTQDVAGV